jgi:hypothetical protein
LTDTTAAAADPTRSLRSVQDPAVVLPELTLLIQQDDNGRLTVVVTQSPVGGAPGGTIALPDWLQLRVDAAVGHPRATLGPASPPVGPPSTPRAVGEELFNQLFARDDLFDCFKQSHQRALDNGQRLRLRLMMDVVEKPAVAVVAAAQWELLFWQESFLALSNTTLVRELVVTGKRQFTGRPIRGPIRVLVVASNPDGDLNLAPERDALARLFTGDRFSPDFLDGTEATFPAFARRVRQGGYDIVHFMGHGAFDPQTRAGQLLFHDGLRPASALVDLFADRSETRLVVLNACRSAETSDVPGANPFAGVASALLIAGVPAVVAMQRPIGNDAAIAFSTEMYSGLAAGTPLVDAVDAARKRVKDEGDADSAEWATPVLFMNQDVTFTAAPSPAATATPVATTPVPVSRRYALAAGALGVAGALGFAAWIVARPHPGPGPQPAPQLPVESPAPPMRTVIVSGRVVDGRSKKGVAGVGVNVEGYDADKPTDADGTFHLELSVAGAAGQARPQPLDLTFYGRSREYKGLTKSIVLDANQATVDIGDVDMEPQK